MYHRTIPIYDSGIEQELKYKLNSEIVLAVQIPQEF